MLGIARQFNSSPLPDSAVAHLSASSYSSSSSSTATSSSSAAPSLGPAPELVPSPQRAIASVFSLCYSVSVVFFFTFLFFFLRSLSEVETRSLPWLLLCSLLLRLWRLLHLLIGVCKLRPAASSSPGVTPCFLDDICSIAASLFHWPSSAMGKIIRQLYCSVAGSLFHWPPPSGFSVEAFEFFFHSFSFPGCGWNYPAVEVLSPSAGWFLNRVAPVAVATHPVASSLLDFAVTQHRRAWFASGV